MKYYTSLHFISEIYPNTVLFVNSESRGLTGGIIPERSRYMENILFEHNLKAYEAASLLMQETGRAAVIHPTGTGKSFIAFKLCADNKNKKICWLSPSEYIYKTQEEKWLSAGGKKCQNISFFTYAKLMRMGGEEIPVQSFDYIILDEFHRLGAAQWGAGVERLWAKYPDARVLGLSATNIRYLDNQRDMAWELFGGNIASGRALAAGGRKAPLIFDIVMNIENLCSIGAVEEELGETVLCHRASGCKDEIVQTHFNVVDEVGDCRKLFRQLNEALGASWEAMYALAKDYYLEHGNLLAPAHYSTASGYSLGAWLATQRKVYLGKVSGNLSVGQVKRLESIGMVWEGKGSAAWEEGYAAARGYYLRHGNLAVPAVYETVDGFRLGRWIRRQREVHREILQRGDTSYFPDGGDMEGDGNSRVQTGFREPGEAGDISDVAPDARIGRYAKRFKRLEEIGMVWENGDSWEYRFHLAEEYYKKHGSLDMPADYIVEGVWLGRWLREQRGCLAGEESTGNLNKLKKSLNAEQKEKLISIGLTPEQSRKELSWRQQYGEAEEFYREHGNLCIPKRYIAGNITIFLFNYVGFTNLVFKEYFQRSPKEFYLDRTVYTLVTIIVCFISKSFTEFIVENGILGILFKFVACSIITNGLLLLVYNRGSRFSLSFQFLKKIILGRN